MVHCPKAPVLQYSLGFPALLAAVLAALALEQLMDQGVAEVTNFDLAPAVPPTEVHLPATALHVAVDPEAAANQRASAVSLPAVLETSAFQDSVALVVAESVKF